MGEPLCAACSLDRWPPRDAWLACAAGFADCGDGSCTDLTTTDNCGGCGQTCPSNAAGCDGTECQCPEGGCCRRRKATHALCGTSASLLDLAGRLQSACCRDGGRSAPGRYAELHGARLSDGALQSLAVHKLHSHVHVCAARYVAVRRRPRHLGMC